MALLVTVALSQLSECISYDDRETYAGLRIPFVVSLSAALPNHERVLTGFVLLEP